MARLRTSLFLAVISVALFTPNLAADNTWCPPEEASCDGEALVQEPGQSPGGSTCKKCVTDNYDGHTECKDPNLYKPAQGKIVSPCEAYVQCYWAGWWECYWDCRGTQCYSV